MKMSREQIQFFTALGDNSGHLEDSTDTRLDSIITRLDERVRCIGEIYAGTPCELP